MNQIKADLLRIEHGRLPGHQLVVRKPFRGAITIATVYADGGQERVLHVLHLKHHELVPLVKALIDAVTQGDS